MRVLIQHDDKVFHTHQLDGVIPIQPPFSGTLFPCLICDHIGGSTYAEKLCLARSLVSGGCRYAVCAGYECGEWHNVFDEVAFELKHFVMTTSHEDEAPDDVAFFFALNTNFEHEFLHYLVLHIGNSPDQSVIDDRVRHYGSGGTAA